MLRYGQHSSASFRDADAVSVLDTEGKVIVQAWGQDVVPRLSEPGTAAHKLRVVEVEVDVNQPDQVLAVLKQVEESKGRLPNEAKRYRDQHA
jgi:hypothetical protein